MAKDAVGSHTLELVRIVEISQDFGSLDEVTPPSPERQKGSVPSVFSEDFRQVPPFGILQGDNFSSKTG